MLFLRRCLADADFHASDVDFIIANVMVPDVLPMQVASSVAHELRCREVFKATKFLQLAFVVHLLFETYSPQCVCFCLEEL